MQYINRRPCLERDVVLRLVQEANSKTGTIALIQNATFENFPDMMQIYISIVGTLRITELARELFGIFGFSNTVAVAPFA